MPKKIIVIQGTVPDDPSCNRSVLADYEWELLKDAIDAAREDVTDSEPCKILMSFGLWDTFYDCPDEAKITQLYMDNA